MDRYELFVAAMQQSNRNIAIAFIASMCIVAGYYSINWAPKNWGLKVRPYYLAWWLLIFLLFFILKFE